MLNETEVKEIVKQQYGEIAQKTNSDCGCGCSDPDDFSNLLQKNYVSLNGYVKEADLKLGCGVPTEFAGIEKDDTVVDLGSGAGNDVFVARAIVGDEGRVIGIDMTEAMIEKAEKNNSKLGFTNIEFHLGEIENMPLENDIADVVISNCVLNLVPNKEKAFKEIYRILKPGAHFCVSDIVIEGKMSEELQKSAELYAGCVSGAIDKEDYLAIIKDTGFKNVEIKQSIKTDIPDDLINKYLSNEGKKDYLEQLQGIYSITVVAYK